MPRGCAKGENRGQGRKKGGKNKITIMREQTIESVLKNVDNKLTPLEVLLAAMNEAYETAVDYEKGSTSRFEYMRAAAAFAKEAAPYIHSKRQAEPDDSEKEDVVVVQVQESELKKAMHDIRSRYIQQH